MLIDDAAWNKRKNEWLPSAYDGDFIAMTLSTRPQYLGPYIFRGEGINHQVEWAINIRHCVGSGGGNSVDETVRFHDDVAPFGEFVGGKNTLHVSLKNYSRRSSQTFVASWYAKGCALL